MHSYMYLYSYIYAHTISYIGVIGKPVPLFTNLSENLCNLWFVFTAHADFALIQAGTTTPSLLHFMLAIKKLSITKFRPNVAFCVIV